MDSCDDGHSITVDGAGVQTNKIMILPVHIQSVSCWPAGKCQCKHWFTVWLMVWVAHLVKPSDWEWDSDTCIVMTSSELGTTELWWMWWVMIAVTITLSHCNHHMYSYFCDIHLYIHLPFVPQGTWGQNRYTLSPPPATWLCLPQSQWPSKALGQPTYWHGRKYWLN